MPWRAKGAQNVKSRSATEVPGMLSKIRADGPTFKRINQKLGTATIDKKVYVEIIAGLNAVAYRLVGCAAASGKFNKSITKDGDGPPLPARYLQEQSLFDFFVNGASAIESLSYSLHAIAYSLDKKGHLSMDEKRMRFVTPSTVAKHFTKTFGAEEITGSFRKMTNAVIFAEWKRIRNVLIHRGTPGRDFVLGPDAERTGAKWRVGIPLNATTTTVRYDWLVSSLNQTLYDLETFLAKYLR